MPTSDPVEELAERFCADQSPTARAARQARRRWARETKGESGSAVPVYGSTAWCSLPIDDPRRLAAAINAAEAWARDGDELAYRLRQEIQARRAAEARLDEEAAREWGRRYRASLQRPSYAELERRRGEDHRPRLGAQENERCTNPGCRRCAIQTRYDPTTAALFRPDLTAAA